MIIVIIIIIIITTQLRQHFNNLRKIIIFELNAQPLKFRFDSFKEFPVKNLKRGRGGGGGKNDKVVNEEYKFA